MFGSILARRHGRQNSTLKKPVSEQRCRKSASGLIKWKYNFKKYVSWTKNAPMNALMVILSLVSILVIFSRLVD